MSAIDRYEYKNGKFYCDGNPVPKEAERDIPAYYRSVLREMEGEAGYGILPFVNLN